jgi:hypothetical protein
MFKLIALVSGRVQMAGYRSRVVIIPKPLTSEDMLGTYRTAE